ncbi:FAD-dependent monooxygenase [Verrucomicrobiales bacterium]|nr:FAD-dependent monooxygenase [Verrucomicrobiales bacterium]
MLDDGILTVSGPREVDICIAGEGPSGAVLGYLLGRCGISTLMLEGQRDFDRDFRVDTLHAGVVEIFASIGLAEQMNFVCDHLSDFVAPLTFIGLAADEGKQS